MIKEQIGLATLYLGDCRELNSIECDLCITDPPYGISYVSSRRKSGKTEMLHSDDEAPIDVIPLISSSIKEGGAIYLATRYDVASQWNDAIIESGLKMKTPIFWDKGNHTSGDLEGDFGAQVEIFIFAHKGRHKLRGKRLNNLWHIPRDNAGFHPTPKPVNLMSKMISCSSDSGNIIYDPFMGSGSTGVAAVSMYRKFIGCEIEKKYFDISCRRIEDSQRQKSMFDFA
jgi:DNA modification methylase